MNLALNKVIRTIPANGVSVIDVTGTFFQFATNTGSFNFSIDGGPYLPGFCVLTVQLPKGPQGQDPTPFRQIILQDTSGAQNTITVLTALGPVEYTPYIPTAITSNAPTAPVCSGVKNLADGAASTAYTGVSATGKARRYFILTNLNASGGANIYFNDGTNNGTPAFPQQTIVLETSGQCYVQNTAGSGASNYMVTEIFYT